MKNAGKPQDNLAGKLEAWAAITRLSVELRVALLASRNPDRDPHDLWVEELKRIMAGRPYP